MFLTFSCQDGVKFQIRRQAERYYKIQRYALVYAFHVISSSKSMSLFCRECTRDLVQAMILDSVHSEEQAMKTPGLII
jgi:hypothetical protein